MALRQTLFFFFFFMLLDMANSVKGREGERREEEKKRKKRSSRKAKVWNSCLEVWKFRNFWEFMYGILLWKSCRNISIVMFGTYMLGNTCLSWVRKTLTLQYKCILVGLS